MKACHRSTLYTFGVFANNNKKVMIFNTISKMEIVQFTNYCGSRPIKSLYTQFRSNQNLTYLPHPTKPQITQI